MANLDHLSDEELEAIASGKGGTPATAAAPATDDLSHLSDEELQAIALGAPNPNVGERPPMSALDSAIINGSQAATLGFGDELVAGLRTATDTLNPMNKGATLKNVGETYNSNLADERSQLAQARNEHPVASMAGGIGGGTLTAIASGGTALAPEGLVASGALAGGIQGVGEGEGGLKNRLESGAKGATLGAVFGGVLKGAGALSKAGLKAVSRYFDTDTLQAAAVGATKADLKRGSGPGSVKDAVKVLDEIGVFNPRDGAKLPPSLDEIRDTAQQVLDHGAEQVGAIIKQVDDVAPRTTAANIDISDIVDLRDQLARNVTDKGSANAVNEIHSLLGNFEERFARNPEGVSLSELQEYKQTLQNRIVELGGYGPGEAPKALVEAMESLADKVRARIENVADHALPPEQHGLIKMYNKGQAAALTLLPKIDSKLATESLAGANPGSFKNIFKFAGSSALGSAALGPIAGPLAGAAVVGADAALSSTSGMLLRARLPRTVAGIKAQLPALLPTLEKMNPGLAAEAQRIMALPKNQMIPAMQPLMQEFGQFFDPSPYPSLVDGRLYSPQDVEGHKAWINDNVTSITEKAKQLSALNKDGTVLQLPTQ